MADDFPLNPDDGMFAAPLWAFIKGTRGIICEYRDWSAACSDSSASGKDWGGGFLTGLETALKHIAVEAWPRHPDLKSEWAYGLSWPRKEEQP